MGWLDTIRTLLGFDSDDRGEDRSTVAITVEKEPDATSERAVKEPVDSADDDSDSRESAGERAEAAETAPEEDGESEGEEITPEEDGESEGDETALDEEAKSEGDETAADEEPAQDGESEADDGRGGTLTDIQGIGSAYADRLENAGIADVDALAAADPENLAERANISTKRIQRWIDRATDR